MQLLQELRPGNYILHKHNNKIGMVQCNQDHFMALFEGDSKNIFPVILKADLLERCGFIENKEYALYPEAREFKLMLAVQGGGKNEVSCYIKSNGECFGRALVNDAVASNNFFKLHQLQNLVYALTGAELVIT
jgi:hypothetical protein